MSTIFRDKVTVSSAVIRSFNDPVTLPDWSGAYTMKMDLLEGWSRTTDVNVISSPRGVGDGAYTAKRFPALPRNLTVGGYVSCPDRSTMDSLWDQIVAEAFPVDTDIVLTRYEPIPKYVTCRVASPMEITQYMPDEGAFRWEGTLLCSDPFKYDAVTTLSGTSGVAGLSTGGRTYPRVYPLVYTVVGGGEGNQVIISPIGTARSYPTITLHGPLPSGWRVDNITTGDSISFDISLADSDTLIVDVKNKIATLNGSLVNGLVQGTWFALQRGTNILKLYADYNASASFTVTAKSTWR